MKRLLIFVDWYLPGYKAGGQISSCSNIVLALKDQAAIYIITRDRDLDDTEPYPGIAADTWQQQEPGVTIQYVSPGNNSYKNFRKLIQEISPETIYFNSMFSYRFTLLPLWILKRLAFNYKVVLAPRGMLQEGALQFKSLKKRTLLSLFYYTGIFKKIVFHATDETEVKDIQKNIKGHPQVKLVYDFPAMRQDPLSAIDKRPGSVKCLFVSRIVEKKNLLYLLRLMAKTTRNISLTIAGPIENAGYWEECLRQIKDLPSNCSVAYRGSVPKHQLPEVYKAHHLFVLPTLGENFGHVIFDAFLNGRPVLISNKTPWQQLPGKKAGFDIELADKAGFLAALEYFADMDTGSLANWCNHAWLLGKHHIDQAWNLKSEYKLLFS